jgi:hypothetical protein
VGEVKKGQKGKRKKEKKGKKAHDAVILQNENDGDLLRSPSLRLLPRIVDEPLDGPLDALVLELDVAAQQRLQRLTNDPMTRFPDPSLLVSESNQRSDDLLPRLTVTTRRSGTNEDAGTDEGVKTH